MSIERTSAIGRHWPLLVVLLLGVLAWADLRRELQQIQTDRRTAATMDAADVELDAGAPAEDGDAWRCEGTIASEDVRATLGQHGREVFDCYERRRVTAPALRGTVDVELLVDRLGRVREVRVDGDLAQDAALAACVRRSVVSWGFPRPSGGECAVVSTPFLLGPLEDRTPPAP